MERINEEDREMNLENNLHFYDGVYHKDYFYFSSIEYNSLFRIKKNDTVAEYIGEFLKEDYFQENMHCQVIKEGNKLYFIPYNGHGISIFDISESKFDFVNLAENNKYISYVRAIPFKGEWLLIPSSSKDNFLIFDANSKSVSIQKKINDVIEEKMFGTYRIDVYGSLCINEHLYIVFFNTPYILEVNIENEDVRWHHIGTAHLANIESDGTFFWLTTLNGDVYRWDCQKDNIEKYTVSESGKREFMRCISWNNKLFLLPNENYCLWEFNYESNRWESMEHFMPQEFKRELTSFSLMMGHGVIDNQLVLYPRSGNGALIISNDNKMIYKKIISKILVTKLLVNKKMKQLQIKGELVVENKYINLKCFIESVLGGYSSGS